MNESFILLITAASCVVFILFVTLLLIKAFYVKVEQGTALIINGLAAKSKVVFTGALVLPVIHKKEIMSTSLMTFVVDRRGKDGLICQDNIRADIAVTFYLKVEQTAESVLAVANAVGVSRASDQASLNFLFGAKFSEALKTAGKRFNMHELFEKREEFREEIKKIIGTSLSGYTLEDAAIDFLEHTPKSSLDPNNIFDAEGIRKISEITAKESIMDNAISCETEAIINKAQKDKELEVSKQNVEKEENQLLLERNIAAKIAETEREKAITKAREASETSKAESEEHTKAEMARIKAEEDIRMRREIYEREVQVAEYNRNKAILLEEEVVNRAKELAIVEREREVALQKIAKERALEEERKTIAVVQRDRIAVEKEVAIEEENIKEVRRISEAQREKQVALIEAQAEAEKRMLEIVKQAEADKDSATFTSQRMAIMAQAELDAATKQAESKRQIAKGIEAEESALGLAEAVVIKAKLLAEADGLAERYLALSTLKGEARQHEEFRVQIEKTFEEAMSTIEANKVVARAQADIISAAMSKAKIDIVSGDPSFYNSLAKSITMGKVMDGVVEKSSTFQSLFDAVINKVKGGAESLGKQIENGDIDFSTISGLAGKYLNKENNDDLSDFPDFSEPNPMTSNDFFAEDFTSDKLCDEELVDHVVAKEKDRE